MAGPEGWKSLAEVTVPVALIMAFSSQRLMPLVDGWHMLIAGSLLSGGIIIIHFAQLRGSPHWGAVILASVPIGIGIVIFGFVAIDARNDAASLDARCAKIVHAVRSGVIQPDKFEAYGKIVGCRGKG